MYCPHCGRVMVLTDGLFSCDAGGMTLSQHMHQVLSERFPLQRPRSPDAEVGFQLHRWYCPGCGIPLKPGMVCGSCDLSIHDQMFRLVEIHPHCRR